MNTFIQESAELSAQKQATFLSTVWTYFGLAVAVASLGAWAGMPILFAVGSPWIPFIAFMAMMFTQGMWINSKTFRIPMFFLFTFISGVILAPTLYFAGATGQIGAVVQALVAASGTFFAAALFGYVTKKDLSGWGQFLFMGMMGLLIVGLMSIAGQAFNIGFLQFGDTFSYIYSGISIVIFAAYTSYDLQNIKNGLYSSPLQAAMSLYINMFILVQNMLNLFLSRD